MFFFKGPVKKIVTIIKYIVLFRRYALTYIRKQVVIPIPVINHFATCKNATWEISYKKQHESLTTEKFIAVQTKVI